MRLVAITLTLTSTEVTHLVLVARQLRLFGDVDGEYPEGAIERLMALGLLEQMPCSDFRVTVAGELVIQSTGNDSVVNQ